LEIFYDAEEVLSRPLVGQGGPQDLVGGAAEASGDLLSHPGDGIAVLDLVADYELAEF
jgi:hypothetical protein